MRSFVLAVLMLAACNVVSSQAEEARHGLEARGQLIAAHSPTYSECFKLGWVRGVHVERGEWDDFYAQCAASRVPFQSGMAVDSVERDRAAHQPHG